MRLTNQEIRSIKESFHQVFGTGKIYLFNSRVDDSSKGGDIDLFIELDTTPTVKETLDKIGEQKIDVIVSKDKTRPIEKEALSKGVLL
jgi:predicted nucleotidyltransferase